MSDNKKIVRPDIQGEMDEFQRLSQDLAREDDINISVDEIVNAFKKSKEETLSSDVWAELENTESNEIEKGDINSVMKIAKMYNKTNPKKLVEVLKSGSYQRPLILKLGGRHILVAGNTRLCTAAAIGMNPKVFIGKINLDSELNEKWSEKYKKSIDCNNPKGFSQRAHCQGRNKKTETKEMTGADSAGAFEGPAFGGMVKRDIKKIHNFGESLDASSTGSYDVPLFGSSPKGRKNPLSIGGPETLKTSRAVKDKKFPKWGGPGGVFIKIKDKCKKYPYCNQGDINAIEILRESIDQVSKETGVPRIKIENIVLNEITKIFIEYETK
jgi:hypothetical protein